MDNQEFQKLVLNWMERVDDRLGSLEQNVSWIKENESSSMHRANLAIGLIISWVK